MNKHIYLVIIIFVILYGCKSVRETEKIESESPKEPTPIIAFYVGTLNISKNSTKYSKCTIETLAAIIKKENIDIVAIQEITRYPDLKNRLDFINELQSQVEMYWKFAEIQNISGRQLGNAVFSSYPIKTSENFEYSKLTGLHSALSVLIDIGIKNVLIVSTSLPNELTENDKLYCLSEWQHLYNKYNQTPLVITGNLFQIDDKQFRNKNFLKDFKLIKKADLNIDNVSEIYFVDSDNYKPLETKIEETDFGKMLIYKFGLYTASVSQND